MDERDYDTIIIVARYLGVAPWELEQHPEWIERGARHMKRQHERRAERSTIMIDGDLAGVPIPRVDAVATRRAY